MPYKCSIKGCRSNYDSTSEKVSMFQFPADINLRNKWLKNVQLNSNLTNSTRICVKHFPSSQIDCTSSRRISLKPDAVPGSDLDEERLEDVEVVEFIEEQDDFLETKVNIQRNLTTTTENLKDSSANQQEDLEDRIYSFEDFCSSIENFVRTNDWNISIHEMGVCLYRLSQPDEKFSDLKVSFKLLINKDLHVRIYKDDFEACSEELDWVLNDCELVTWNQFERIIDHYQLEPEIIAKQDNLMYLKKAFQLLDLITNEQLKEKIEIVKDQLAELYEEIELLADYKWEEHQEEFLDPEPTDCKSFQESKTDSTISYFEENAENEQIMETEEIVPFEPRYEQLFCDICGESFRNMNQLQKHLKLHANSERNKCSHCNQTFDSVSLKNHLKTAHANMKPYKCEICSKSFLTPSLRNEHLKTHSKNLDYQHYLVIIDGSPRYACPKCPTYYENSHFLKKHIATNCRQAPKKRIYRYSCYHCSKSFVSKNLAIKHIQGVHNIEIQNREKYCFICNAEFEDYVNHSREHSCNFSCHKCGAKFLTQEKMTKHEESKHSHESIADRPFKCSEFDCGLAFKNINHLKSHHQAIHSQTEREFQCSVCSKRFAFRSLLTAHSRSHSKNLAKFPCNVSDCERRFNKLNNLKVHAFRDHGIDSIYLCGFAGCSVRFKMLNELKQHRDKEHGDSFNIQKYFDNSK